MSSNIIKLYLLLFLGVSGNPQKQRVDLLIRSECLTKPVILIDCDVTVDPPKCRSSSIAYRPSCAQIVIEPKTAKAEQRVCRADMDGENQGYLWASWDDWYWDECAKLEQWDIFQDTPTSLASDTVA